MRNILYIGIPLAFLSLLGAGCSRGSENGALNPSPDATGTAPQNLVTSSGQRAGSSTTTAAFDRRLKEEYAKDNDLDGLLNDEEPKRGTNPDNPDSDGDGILDGAEITITKTNPLKADTDGDGMKDGAEVLRGRDPLKKDGAPTSVRPASGASR